MAHKTFSPTRQRVRLCAHYTMHGFAIAAIALIVAFFVTTMFKFPNIRETVSPAFYLFVAWLFGVSCAYSLPIWKYRGPTC